ncbi:hypothetical protein ACSQ67_020967 [Phaseolus vulgaris]
MTLANLVNGWIHMMVIVVLLHVNCFAQYALSGLNWGFNRSERPVVGVCICISIAIAAPALAGVYCIASPLGKEYKTDEESQNHIPISNTFASRNEHSLTEYTPQWRGGLFDLWDNLFVACLALFCSFCAFGRNMERLRFGNMYEVRTTEFYDIVDDNFFCQKPTENCGQPALNSLPSEDKAPQVTSVSTSFWSSHDLSKIWSEESKDYSSLSESSFQEKESKMLWKRQFP